MEKPFAITLNPGSSLANHTGSWRTARPVYLDRLPPCNNQCPAGEDIQGWLFHAESGNYEAAWRHLTRDNPFPRSWAASATTPARACNRGKIDEAVGINSVERFLGDEAIKRGWKFAAAGARSRQARADRRRRPLGHVGRLPPAVARPRRHRDGRRPLHGRHDALRHPQVPPAARSARRRDAAHRRHGRHGQAQQQGHNILEQMKAGKFDAAFLAVGAHIGKRAMIPSGDAAKIVDAISVLRSMEGEDKPMLGRRVVVYGGGNTAIDVARSVKRMGAEPIIVYRRTRDKAPAHDFEIEEALQEGVMVKWLSTIKQAGEKEITIEKMALDDKGFPQPTGEFETLEADSVVLALGQDVDLGLLNGVPGLEVRTAWSRSATT
jgi:NADPH-dependent glutamate synthase beta subunit-like oxidoreductase